MAVSQIIGASIADGTIAAIDITDGTITTAKLAATTGSGSVVLSASPTITGNLTVSGTQTNSALTSGRITYASTGGLLTDSSALTFDGTTITATKFAGALNGSLGATTPSTVVATSVTNSGLTSGRVTYAGTSGLLTDSSKLTFDGANLGVGITPNAWSSLLVGLQISTSAVFSGQDGSEVMRLGSNWYYSSGFKYIGTGYSTLYEQSNGSHFWYNAPSGTAGNTITFTQAMTLNASGHLGIGTTSPSSFGALAVRKAATVSSVPVSASFSDSANSTFDIRHSPNIVNLNAQGSGITINTGNSTKMTITDAGLVGIGAASPSVALEVAGSAKLTNGNLSIVPSTTTNSAYILNTNASGNFFFAIDTSTGASFTGTAYARAIYSGGAYPMVFLTNDTERMRITSTGLVGIGTSSPQALLHVAGKTLFATASGAYEGGFTSGGTNTYSLLYAASTSGTLYFGVNGTAAASPIDITGISDNASFFGSRTAHSTQLISNNSVRMSIASNGDVTIGNAVAGTNVNLNLNGVANKAQRIYFSNSGVEKWLIGAGAASETSAFEIYNTNGTMVLSIDKTSSVSSFGAPVNVYGNMIVTRNAIIGINGDNVAAGTFAFRNVSGVQKAAIASYYNVADEGALEFMNGTTTNMILRSSGNVGIGTTSPNYQLHVTTSMAVGASGFNQQLSFTNDTIQSLLLGTGYTALKLNPLGGNVGIGTSSPAEKLVVDGPVVAKGQLQALQASSLVIDYIPAESVGRIIATGPNSSTYSPIIFASTTSSTYAERMRIDSSGRLGVGITSPVAPINVMGLTSSTSTPILYLQQGGASPSYGYTFKIDNVTTGDLYLNRYDNNADAGNLLTVRTDGSLLVGRTSQGSYSQKLNLLQTGASVGGIQSWCDSASFTGTVITARASRATTNNSYTFFQCSQDGVGDKLYIFDSGNVYNTTGTYGTLSDIKLKENIVDATSKLNDVMALKVRNFNLKSEPELKQIGFIAQELETIFPSMVEETLDQTKIVKTTVLIPILVKAIQEQQALIESLTSRLTALEGK